MALRIILSFSEITKRQLQVHIHNAFPPRAETGSLLLASRKVVVVSETVYEVDSAYTSSIPEQRLDPGT